MPFPGYDPSRIKGTLEPTLPDPPGAPLRFFSFRNFFGLFTPSSPSYTTMPNTPFTCSTVSSSSTPIPTTLNYCICQAIACLNKWERCKE